MGLRESLKDFFTMSEAAQGAEKATGSLRDRLEMQAIGKDLPAAIQSGDLSEVAGRAYGIGDPSLLREALGQQSALAKAAMKPEDTPLTMEQLRQAYPTLSPEQLNVIASAPSRNAQRLEIGNVASVEGRAATQALAREEATRRMDDKLQQARTDFTSKFNQQMQKNRDEIKQLEELATMDLADTTQFWLSATNAIKSIGRESGALTDRDINRPFPATAGRTLRELGNWMSLRDPRKNPIDPKTVESLRNIIMGLKEKRQQMAADKAKNVISKEAVARRDRLGLKDGQIDPVIEETAGEFGLVAQFKDGKLVVDKEIPMSTERIDLDSRGAKNAGALIQKVKDPARQAKYIKALQKGGGTLPPEIMQALENEVK
jgi:hypothetical protein